jgi:hypothetical protein
MKRFFLPLAALACSVTPGIAQNYQAQYPYDPYNAAPTPQQYQEYQSSPSQPNYSYGGGGGSGGGDYGKQSYGSGAMNSGSGSRYAELLSWGHLEGYYAYNDFRGDDELDGDSGFGVDLRVQVFKIGFLHFGLDRILAEGPNAQDLEMTSVSAGGGAFIPIGERVHLYGEVGFRYDWTGGDLDYIYKDDISLYFRPGVRFAVTENFELTASVLFSNTDNFNEYVIEVSGYYALLDWLDVGGGVDIGDDYNTYRVGGRWRW